MQPNTMQPQKVLAEISDYYKNLGEGVENLLQSGDIDCGVTPREVVYQEDKLTLYRYSSEHKVENQVPLLIIYALVNRPYMTDIQEDRSTIRNLLAHGQDVYLIDWGYPDNSDRFLSLEDYIEGYINNCVDTICKEHSLDAINLLGICQGGTFSLCYSSLHPEKVNSLVTMVTPVDFKTPDNMLSAWVQHMDVDLLVNTLGNIPGDMLNWTFLSMKPYSLMGQKYINMVDIIGDKNKLQNFMRMEKWIFDSPDQAGECFRQFIKYFYQDNALLKGELKIGENEIDLKNLKMPVLNIFAEQDHLVPPNASRALRTVVGSDDYTEISFPGGHIGIYVSGKAQKNVTPAIAKWLNERS